MFYIVGFMLLTCALIQLPECFVSCALRQIADYIRRHAMIAVAIAIVIIGMMAVGTEGSIVNDAKKGRYKRWTLYSLNPFQSSPLWYVDSWGQYRSRHSTARGRLKLVPIRLFALATIIAMRTSSRPTQFTTECDPFDTDSEGIGVDNRCSSCISHVRSDFYGGLVETTRGVHGFGGRRQFRIWTGTIKWQWDDDQGESHTFLIPNSYYIPAGGVRLLSPQHWAQTRRGLDRRGGAGEVTTADNIQLFWNNRCNNRTIPIDRDSSNVATFQMTPGYTRYDAYCAEALVDNSPEAEADPITVMDVNAVDPTMVSDDEDEYSIASSIDDDNDMDLDSEIPLPTTHTELDLNGPATEAGLNPMPNVIIDETEEHQTPTGELLRLHYDFGHIPFSKLQAMAKRGSLPKRLAKCHVPLCSACQYAKATKRKWRPRTARNYKPKVATEPGEVVSVDQLVSPTPGLIAQITGFLTKKRYKYATVYVDQASSLGYVYLQKTATVEETLESKKAFERYAASRGVIISAYHADNGIFKARAWVQECDTRGQPLTFAAVGAHHTNGKAERRIRELQEMARTALIHAHKRWPEAINAHLWPYAIRHANNCINATPSLQDKHLRSPLQLFTRTMVEVNKKHWKPFGAPVYVLESELQANKPFHTWRSRARVGIYLGQSPFHNKEVALVLDRNTGYDYSSM